MWTAPEFSKRYMIVGAMRNNESWAGMLCATVDSRWDGTGYGIGAYIVITSIAAFLVFAMPLLVVGYPMA